MSEQASLSSLKGMYLVFTEQAGVLRALRMKEPTQLAQGLHFHCPQCADGKGVTLLFDFPNVPKKAQPKERFHPNKEPVELDQLTIREKTKCPHCTWQGYVTEGKVYWKSLQS